MELSSALPRSSAPREHGHHSACRGHGSPVATAPTLQPQHPAGTAGTPGLLRASHKPGPAALHSSRVGPWGAVITSCQQPRGAPHPQNSWRTRMCPGLVRAQGSALGTIWFCSQCQPLLRNTLKWGMLQFPWISVSVWTCRRSRGAQTASHSPHMKSEVEANNNRISQWGEGDQEDLATELKMLLV